MVRRAVLILLSLLLVWNLACGFIWIEAVFALPAARASDDQGYLDTAEDRQEYMKKAVTRYREQTFDFSANLVMIAMAVNVASLVAALGLILSPSVGWPVASPQAASGGRESLAAKTPQDR